jgi:maleylpyruvate isomerase
MRTREVWIHAVDLDNGATFADIPEPVLTRLLQDITSAWAPRGTDTGLRISVTGSGQPPLLYGDGAAESPVEITGPLAAVVEWAAGRGSTGVTASGAGTTEGTPAAPAWI